VARVGEVVVEQRQRVLKLDVAALEALLRRLLALTGCAHMDVGVCLTNDVNIRKLNGGCFLVFAGEYPWVVLAASLSFLFSAPFLGVCAYTAQYRGMQKATDVLSFPNHNAYAIDGDFPGDPTTFAQTEVCALILCPYLDFYFILKKQVVVEHAIAHHEGPASFQSR
jgi:hypothetical protein